jgi:hypothetical protein
MYQQFLSVLSLVGTLQGAALAQEPPMTALRPDQVAFRALYREFVETNTTLSAGSCTLLAQRIAAHLKAAGFSARLSHRPRQALRGRGLNQGTTLMGAPWRAT